jgi:hypothetical protein
MKKLALVGFAAVAVLNITAGTTSAQYYNPGYYPTPSYYYADEPRYARYYRHRYYRHYYRPRYYQPYESPWIAPGVRIAPCPPGYTWNQGACRPYRGY